MHAASCLRQRLSLAAAGALESAYHIANAPTTYLSARAVHAFLHFPVHFSPVSPAPRSLHAAACGSCWAFAAAAALESTYLIANKLTTPLSDAAPAAIDVSEQQLTSCVNAAQGAYSSIGCNGGDPFDVRHCAMHAGHVCVRPT